MSNPQGPDPYQPAGQDRPDQASGSSAGQPSDPAAAQLEDARAQHQAANEGVTAAVVGTVDETGTEAGVADPAADVEAGQIQEGSSDE